MTKKETTKKIATKKVKAEKKSKVEKIEMIAESPIEEPTPEPVPIEEPDQPVQIEVMNGDPAVLTDPVTENGTVAEPLRARQEEPESVEETAPVEEINPQKSIFRRMFGYIWNGQEMDY